VPEDQLTPSLVEVAKARGFQVVGWTIDKSARIRQAAEMGVDGIITNYPGKARKVLQRP
jgi:glycerophosphoryl diester phosphodiesterase